ncbi:glycoside hydrolase family 61 protein [Hyaloscypha finlandica]|nr:glycoside hydrolase family 61 protein [Hyaloscypha finlandica]
MFQDMWVNGVDESNTCTRMLPSNSPVTTVTPDDIRCNSQFLRSDKIMSAGGNMTAEMHAQPGDRSCSNQAIGGNHFGSSSTCRRSQTQQRTAALDTLNSNCDHGSFTIPASISPGEYLVRAEAVALHAAQSAGGAQFYMSCYQVNITGGGAASPDGLSFPGAYKATDPGILIDIYKPITVYAIPGPAVFAE